MTLVKGDIRLVTNTPAAVSQVWVRAPKPRTQGLAYVSESSDTVQVDNGVVEFTALPGAAVMVLVQNGVPTDTVKLIVPDKETASLRECIDAVGLVDDGTLNTLELLALDVAENIARIGGASQIDQWIEEAQTAQQQAGASANKSETEADRSGREASRSTTAAQTSETHATRADTARSGADKSKKDAEQAAQAATQDKEAAHEAALQSAASANDSDAHAGRSSDSADRSEAGATRSETEADRSEYWATETRATVEGDFATHNYVDNLADQVEWAHDIPDTSWNIEDFPQGVWKVENAAQRQRLGLPNKLGVLTMHVVSPNRQSVQNAKTAYWLSLSHSSPTEMLVRSTSNVGVWEPEWIPPYQYNVPSKTAAVPLTFPRGSSYSDNRPTLTMRIPFKLGAAVKRARLRLRNYDYRSDYGFPGSYRIVGAGIGKHQIAPGGQMTGLIPAGETITQLMGSTPMGGPEEAKGEWVEVNLEPNVDYLLSYSITADDGMVYTRQTAQCFTSRLSSGWNRTGITTATPSNMAVLAAILDVEVLEDTPVYGYLGDSQTAAISAERPGYDSWAMVHSRLDGAIPTIHGHAGAGLSEWQDPAKPAYGISDGMAKFDRMYISMGSNDIDNGRPFTGVQDYLTSAMQNWRKQTDTFVLHNYLPRTGVESGDTVRQALNDWIRTSLPGGALHTVDIWGATVDPATGLMDERWRGSPADVHMTSAGNARVAMATLGGVMREPVGGMLDAYNRGKGTQ